MRAGGDGDVYAPSPRGAHAEEHIKIITHRRFAACSRIIKHTELRMSCRQVVHACPNMLTIMF